MSNDINACATIMSQMVNNWHFPNLKLNRQIYLISLFYLIFLHSPVTIQEVIYILNLFYLTVIFFLPLLA